MYLSQGRSVLKNLYREIMGGHVLVVLLSVPNLQKSYCMRVLISNTLEIYVLYNGRAFLAGVALINLIY